jgi:DNA topoisomerase-1
MATKYCFNITKKSDKVIVDDNRIKQLKTFIRNLYDKKGKGKFKDTLPFYEIYQSSDDSVCIVMTSRGKDNIKIIEDINKVLRDSDLNAGGGIFLSKPYEFTEEQISWWKEEEKGGDKWKSIVQLGPYFVDIMEPYQPLGASLTLRGVTYKLNPTEEKIASFYANRIIAEKKPGITVRWTEDDEFNKNFWTDFVSAKNNYLTPKNRTLLARYKDFLEIDWSDLVSKIEAKARDMKEITSEEKLRKKIRTEEKKAKYGYASIDGKANQKIGNFTVEPQGIFYGRGKNKNRGKIKKQIFPEDVTINIDKHDPIPSPPPNHTWGSVVHKHDVVWLSTWKDTITGSPKYVWLSAESVFKGKADRIKYEKARKLERYIDNVREKYMNAANSSDIRKMQLGTVLYLIDHFGFRVGNEKGADEAETVGASTLLVGNIKLDSKNFLKFNFLGKDSIQYNKTLKVPTIIYDNFVKLAKTKSDEDEIFTIKSDDINQYLHQFDKSFSAKVFRTRLASEIMYNALKEIKTPEGKPGEIKTILKREFKKANAKVAEVLNHTRTVSIKNQEDLEKLKEDLEKLKSEYKKTKTEKLKTKINNLEGKIEEKSNVMSVAITTSLTNYIDPRLIVSWAQENNVDMKDIYSKLLLRKFKWSIEMIEDEQGWDWVDSPLIGAEELEPSTDKQIKKPGSKKPQPVKPKFPENDSDIPEIESPEKDLESPEKDLESPQIESPKIPKPIVYRKISPKISRVGPGTISDYKYLLEICQDPQIFKQNFIHISQEALEWIYHFSKYAISKGTTVKANEYIVQFYEKVYKDKPKPPPKPSSYNPKPPKPSPKPPHKTSHKPPINTININDSRFAYLNFTLYNNKKRLQEYCDRYNITYNKSKDDKNKLKLLIMEFFADKKRYPNPPTL